MPIKTNIFLCQLVMVKQCLFMFHINIYRPICLFCLECNFVYCMYVLVCLIYLFINLFAIYTVLCLRVKGCVRKMNGLINVPVMSFQYFFC